MGFSLVPSLLARDVTKITPGLLAQRHIRLLMLDFDNTLVPYTTDIPSQEVVIWLQEMTEGGVQLCVVSNSRKNRVPDFCRDYHIPCITRAKKPGTRGIQACLTQFHCPPEAAALVGDQIYTDTLGGNRAGVCTILVKAIDNHNFWLKARHVLELPWICFADKRRI